MGRSSSEGGQAFEEKPTDCYGTPPGQLALTAALWPGGIDLDPFSDPASALEAAACFDIRKGEDAYALEWRGSRVFANGPYSGSNPVRTAQHCARYRDRGAELLNLCPAAPGSAYWRLHVWPWVSAISWLGRLPFALGRDALYPEGHAKAGLVKAKAGQLLHGNRTEIAMCYLGDHPDRFVDLWQGAGFPSQVIR